jgi:hypothetical protein
MNGYKYHVIVNPGSSPALTSNIATLTVIRRAIYISADSKSKVYGFNDPALTAQVTTGTVVGTDAASGSLTRETGENRGLYAITKNTYTYGSNYSETFLGANLNITPLPVNVSAQPITKIFGQPDPPLTFVSLPPVGTILTNGQTILFSGSLTRTPGETVEGSPYRINQGSVYNSNYIISYISGNLTITPLITAALETPQCEVGLKVYPNPFTDHIYFDLQWNKPSKARLVIFNISGINIAPSFSDEVEVFRSYRFEFTIENFINGIFIYQMIIDGRIEFNGKLVHL